MNIPRAFAIIRTVSRGLYYVTEETGNAISEKMHEKADHHFLEITGAFVTLAGESIESVSIVSSVSLQNEVEVQAHLNAHSDDSGESWKEESW